MSIANKYNSATVKFNFEIPETYVFAKPSDLVQAHGINHIHKVRSLYINTKGKYGNEPVIVTDTCLLNAPSHVCDVVQAMLTDDETIKAINDGKLGFHFYEYQNQYGNQYSLVWRDL